MSSCVINKVADSQNLGCKQPACYKVFRCFQAGIGIPLQMILVFACCYSDSDFFTKLGNREQKRASKHPNAN